MTKHFHISSFNSLRPCLLSFFAVDSASSKYSMTRRSSTQLQFDRDSRFQPRSGVRHCLDWQIPPGQESGKDKNIKESHKFAGAVLPVKTGARTIRRCTLHFIHFPPGACGFLGGNGKYDLLTVRWSVVRKRREKSRLRGAHLDVVQLFLSALRAGLLRSVQEYNDRLMSLNRM